MAAQRIHWIDVVRGLAMVLMAIDRVRVYASVPAWSVEPLTFFTRWVTHFCAPAFVILAGTSAFHSGRRLGPAELGRKLLVRGSRWRAAALAFSSLTRDTGNDWRNRCVL